jgi:hypothetical protein
MLLLLYIYIKKIAGAGINSVTIYRRHNYSEWDSNSDPPAYEAPVLPLDY